MKLNYDLKFWIGPLIGFFIFMIVVNLWISREFKSLDSLAVAPTAAKPHGVMRDEPAPAGAVYIDPDNDPLAPVVSQPAVQPPHPEKSSAPEYEAISDRAVLDQ